MGLEEPDCIQNNLEAAKERSSYRLPPRFARSGRRWFCLAAAWFLDFAFVTPAQRERQKG